MYQKIFNQVWRHDSTNPGFYLIDMGVVDSLALRREMIKIKEEFCKFEPFYFTWLNRFDQQLTTKFHKDGGPDENILILGYEPSEVRSSIYICDPPLDVVKLPDFQKGHSYILIINNSNQWGVQHKAEVVADSGKKRIINSMQIAKGNSETDVDLNKFFEDAHL